jgi:ABC-type nitrate/sulfonate/bicarbonate transport system substrate-binding protein
MVVGSYPQPDWLVDRARLSKSVPRTRMQAMYRLPSEHLEAAHRLTGIAAKRQCLQKSGGNQTMKISRLLLATAALLAATVTVNAETIRVGLPTKTYWPTTVAETAVRQKLFEKEGLTAELTIYRSGAETFEGMAAGAADIILDPPSLVSAGRKKGVMSRIVANATMGNFGWQLMVPAKSTLDVKDLNGKKVGITAAGSGSDILALWTIQDRKIDFTRVPVGGGGLVPNLLAGNIDAAVVYSPLSFQIAKAGEAKTILDYAKDVPANLTSGWIVLDKFAQEKPATVQKALNALYGAVHFMRTNKEATVKLIADLYEMPAEIAALEYENTIMKLETDGNMAAPNVMDAVQLSLDLAKLGGLKDIVPTTEVISTQFKPVPTKP